MNKKLFMGAVLALNLCGPCFAARAVTEDDVRQWLAVWQKREGLENWDISLEFVHASMWQGKADAVVRWGGAPCKAEISFSYPEEFETFFGKPPALAHWWAEKAVIHELMHLVLSGLYDDGAGSNTAWMIENPALNARMEEVTENLAQMLRHRYAPGGVPVAQYIAGQINSGPWRPARDVRERVMLQVARAMNAANEDDVVMLASR
jgi:hypothetical protein